MADPRTSIGEALLAAFPYSPTDDQQEILDRLGEFLREGPRSRPLFLLKGYAGTGKTTVVRALVDFMEKKGRYVVLLAPTGRAAKVMGAYAGREAHTVHKWIYWSKQDPDGGVRFELGKNRYRGALFLIDEASMIGGEPKRFKERNLLEDLLSFIYDQGNCRAVLIGDDAQLTPVEMEDTPALDPDSLEREGVKVRSGVLTEVLRQAQDSGILSNATELRQRIALQDATPPFFQHDIGEDVKCITGETLPDELEDAYSRFGIEEVRVVTRSNKRAVQFAREIRSRILGKEEALEREDLLMVVRNDHFWGKKTESGSFIANGDILEVVRIEDREQRFNEHFVDATVKLPDRPDDGEFSVKLWVDCLELEAASIDRERMRELFFRIGERYQGGKGNWKGMVMRDPYFNALQVKYAYGMTCHKAQGGQWPVVFLDPGFLSPEKLDVEYLRWLYTGMTRATQKLCLLNFPAQLFKGDPYAG
ncbi:MAG: ATP-dependent RecD-like DNA helicase [Flavobacteriales bacterium]